MVNLNIYSSNTSNASAKLTLQELNTSNITLSYPNDIITIPPVSSVQIPGTTDEYMVFNYTGNNTNTVGQTVYNITIPENYSADILMVGGGGGGGGDIGGGGGGGAVLYGSNIMIPRGSYSIRVGAGGNGMGVNGYNTEAFGSVCLGGGAAKNKAMYPTIPNDSNLLAWYRFNGDAIDYNPTSTKYDFVTDAGTVSYPAELFQGRKYINMASGSLKNTTIVLRQRAFSVSMWFRWKTTGVHTILAQSISQTTNTTLYIGSWGNGSYFIGFHGNDLTSGTGTGTASSYPDDINTWVFLTYVVEANYNRRVYRNGVLVTFDNNTSAFTGTGDLELLKPYWNGGSYRNADISDLRIYGVAIPATEVAALYSSYINGGITDNSAGSNTGANGGSGAGGRTVNTTANGAFGAGGTIGTSTKSSLLTAATLFQGSAGGTGVTATTGSTNYILSGGGGGAAAVGSAGKSALSTTGTGTGGDGAAFNITGTTFWWGAGGGAGGYATAAGNGGRGGAGGGTSSGTGGTNGTVGANGFNTAVGLNAGSGTGSGGGGGNIITTMSGGSGGSGLVIMRYRRLNEGIPEINFIRERFTMPGYTNYKIGNYNGDFQIRSSTSNIETTTLIVQNGGNVGIGTSAPVNNLHIYSSNNANASAKLIIQELNTSNYALTYPNDIVSYPFVPSISVSGTIDKYMVFTYTSDTTGAGQTQYSINVPETYICDILLVGGGGGGGALDGGGGGAGACIVALNQSFAAGNYTINVGNGGIGGIFSSVADVIIQQSANGGNTTITNSTGTEIYRAVGGGKAGAFDNTGAAPEFIGKTGGCGGGGGNYGQGGASAGGTVSSLNIVNGIQNISPSVTTTYGVYGNAGGNSVAWNMVYANANAAGGGGIGSAGANGVITRSGTGGNGLAQVTINSTTYNFKTYFAPNWSSFGVVSGGLFYIGGGGGGGAFATTTYQARISGGLGGGGIGDYSGSNSTFADAPTDGVANTGSGGGGACGNRGANGGAGGSGIVIIRYRRATQVKGNPELQLICGSSLLSGSNNYKIGNYNGNFAIKSSTSNVDTDKFTIQSSGNIVINETLGNEAKLTIQNTRTINDIISTPSITTSMVASSTDRYMAFPYTTDTAALGQTNYTLAMSSGFYDVLMVGGGGAGGKDIGGGGGGAAVLYATNVFIPTGSYVIKVGRGATPGETIGKSTEGFGCVILGGGSANNVAWDPPSSLGNGYSGGSGGGGKGKQSGYTTIGGKSGISPIGTIFGSTYTIYNGNNGGAGLTQGTGGTKVAGGGGGGAGGVGADPTTATGKGGDGGDGVPINITGTTYWWGAGGGGDTEGINNTIPGGNGGKGGGGAGDGAQAGVTGQTINGNVGTNGYGVASGKDAGTGTGSGGGGARYLVTQAGNGGSGIIIIRYRSGNSSIELLRGTNGDNNKCYKIGNYGGDFKIMSSVSGTDGERVNINSAGYMLVNGFKQPFTRCGNIINNPTFIDIPVLFDITNTNVHTCEIKLHWMSVSSGGPLTIFGIGSISGTGSLITPSETSYKTTGASTEVTTIVSGNVLANTIINAYDATTSIRICNTNAISTSRKHHYICDTVYPISNIGASQTIAKGFIGITTSTNGSLSHIRLSLAVNFSYGDWTAIYYHI